MEDGDHSDCPIELLACPEHSEEQQKMMEAAKLDFERWSAESGFEENYAKIDTMPDGVERDALITEFVAWAFPRG